MLWITSMADGRILFYYSYGNICQDPSPLLEDTSSFSIFRSGPGVGTDGKKTNGPKIDRTQSKLSTGCIKGKWIDHSLEIKNFAEKKMSHLCRGASLSKHLQLMAAGPALHVNAGPLSSKLHRPLQNHNFSLPFNQKLGVNLVIARQLRERSHGQERCGRKYSNTATLGVLSRVLAGAPANIPPSALGADDRSCLWPAHCGWPCANQPWVCGTPVPQGNIYPSQRQACWFSAHVCNLILKKSLGQASESTERYPWVTCSCKNGSCVVRSRFVTGLCKSSVLAGALCAF